MHDQLVFAIFYVGMLSNFVFIFERRLEIPRKSSERERELLAWNRKEPP